MIPNTIIPANEETEEQEKEEVEESQKEEKQRIKIENEKNKQFEEKYQNMDLIFPKLEF